MTSATTLHSTSPVGVRPLRASFVMERHLGHQTFADNLRRCIDTMPDIHGHWVDVTYGDGGVWNRMPVLDDRIRGALSGRREVRLGCAADEAAVRFFNTQVPAVLGGAIVRRAPYVLCTDVTPLQYDNMAIGYGHSADGRGPVSRLKHRANVRAFRGAAVNVAWSTWVQQSLIEDYGVPASRIAVVPPGVDTARWAGGRRTADGPVRLLFVGGQFRRKGGEDLLRAFGLLPRGSAELVIVTQTEFAGGRNIRVINGMQPNSPELVSLFRSSDVFVLPSSAETFGIAAVEAAASGLPVVATDVGGLSDIVIDGETGFLVGASDIMALAERIRRLVDSAPLRQHMGAQARAHARRRFDAERNARRVADLLHIAAARSPFEGNQAPVRHLT